MKIKVIKARSKSHEGKIIDLGENKSQLEKSKWHDVVIYQDVLFGKKLYTAALYTPTESALEFEPNKKPNISLYISMGTGRGSNIRIWEFEEIV